MTKTVKSAFIQAVDTMTFIFYLMFWEVLMMTNLTQ